MVQDQIVEAFDKKLIDKYYLQSLVYAGYDVNMTICGMVDIMYFVLRSPFKTVDDLIESVETVLKAGFDFKRNQNYWFLFLFAISRFTLLEVDSPIRVWDLSMVMVRNGMSPTNVKFYHDPEVKYGYMLIIDTITGEFQRCLSMSMLLSFSMSLSVPIENCFSRSDLKYDNGVTVGGPIPLNVLWLCAIKNRVLTPVVQISTGMLFHQIGGFAGGFRPRGSAPSRQEGVARMECPTTSGSRLRVRDPLRREQRQETIVSVARSARAPATGQ
jgi:hypothetical protein